LQTKRILFFDGLRGCAALLVALFHFSASSRLLDSPFVTNAWLCVDLFFVLSGFVLDRRYFLEQRSGIREFLKARTGRMLPVYFVMLFIFVIIDGYFYLANGGETYDLLYALIVNGALLQSFGFLDKLWFYGPSWSISAELWINLFLFLVLQRVRSAWFLIVLSALSCVVFVFYLNIQTSHDFGWFRCLYGLIVGVLCSRTALAIDLSDRFKVSNSWFLGDIITVMMLYATFAIPAFAPYSPIVFGIVILYGVLCCDSLIVRVLSSKIMVFLGKISFAVYMTHFLIGGRMMRFVVPKLSRKFELHIVTFGDGKKWDGLMLGAGELQGIAFIALYVVLVCCTATLVHYLFEAPVYQVWKKNRYWA